MLLLAILDVIPDLVIVLIDYLMLIFLVQCFLSFYFCYSTILLKRERENKKNKKVLPPKSELMICAHI